jgi:flavodoxin
MKDTSGENVLIAYLSRTKNTKAVAEIIKGFTSGTLVELELQTPYPKDYQANVQQVVKENETGYLPLLKTKIDSIQKYDVIFVGFPTWDMKMPPPVKSFLSQYDLRGKTIIPFNTNAGYGVGSGFQTVKELCPDSKILKGYDTLGGEEKEGVLYVMVGAKKKKVDAAVKKWLQRLKILK